MKTLSVVAGLALNAAIKSPDWRAQMALVMLAFTLWVGSIALFVRAGDVR